LKADGKRTVTISAGGTSLAWLHQVWGYGWRITVHNCTAQRIHLCALVTTHRLQSGLFFVSWLGSIVHSFPRRRPIGWF